MNVLGMRKFDERGYANCSVGDKTPFFGRGWNLGSVDPIVAGIRGGVGRSIDRFSLDLWRKILENIFFFFVFFLSNKNLDYFIEMERVQFLNRIRIDGLYIFGKYYSILYYKISYRIKFYIVLIRTISFVSSSD